MARRTAAKLFQRAIALVLTMVVFGSAVQAGRGYWYCTVMHASMSHACCAAHAQERLSHGAEVTAPECCQSRSLASLDACTPKARAEQELLGQPLLALPVAATLTAHRPQALALAQQAPSSTRQLAPEKLRVHARLMVFNI